MKRYVALRRLYAGQGAYHQPGDVIELAPHEAAPLLESGAIRAEEPAAKPRKRKAK
ncbi:hypothetical protein [Paroceanicella profunda]|uniref:hypothetical protein n=1 Tax=Paroceanicella profunda TaxID=2579971 RepID=UPI001478246F|nr:hypothetical protein [Paroceanicella profunda]